MRLIPEKMEIVKFRNFNNIVLKLGKRITVISGQNGVGKSNILSLIASGSGLNKKGFLGSNFQPEFYDFFNIDKNEDYSNYKLYIYYYTKNNGLAVIKRLSFKDDSETGRGIRIIPRTTGYGWNPFKTIKAAQNDGKLRYNVGPDARVFIPTIYLSISRLYPLGEKKETVNIRKLDKRNILYKQKADEKFKEWYNYVIPNTIGSKDELSLVEKKTSSRASLHMDMVNTPVLSQSIGQDNVGNIISALVDIYMLSKEDNYQGALICIDEVEISLHPDTQLKLLTLLDKVARDYNIQFVLSTHSLTVLKEMLKKEKKDNNDDNNYSVIYLKNPSNPIISEQKSYRLLKADLFNELRYSQPKPKIYFEDDVGKSIFDLLLETFRNIIQNIEEDDDNIENIFRNFNASEEKHISLKEKISHYEKIVRIGNRVSPIITHLGCEELIKIQCADAYFKRVIFMLDGDARIQDSQLKPKVRNYLKNNFDPKKERMNDRKHDQTICFLPGYFAPESYLYRIIYDVTHNELQSQDFWRSLEKKEETALFTADKIMEIFNSLPEHFNNDDVKKCFNDDIKIFVEKTGLLVYYYSDFNHIFELLDYFTNLEKAYNIALPLTISNRYV